MADKVYTRSMKRAWWIGALLVVFIALQFVRPGLTNPPVTAELNAPPEVKAILKNSCYNCHSNETKLPWFDQVAPAYWLLASDVKEARKHLNFSEIAAPAGEGNLYEAVNFIALGAMPLPEYRWSIHPRCHARAASRAARLAESAQAGNGRERRRSCRSRSTAHCALQKDDRPNGVPLLRTTNTGERSAAPTVSTTEPCASSSAMMSP